MQSKPDKEKIIKECNWAIDIIAENRFITMTSRKFFQDVIYLLKDDSKRQVHHKLEEDGL